MKGSIRGLCKILALFTVMPILLTSCTQKSQNTASANTSVKDTTVTMAIISTWDKLNPYNTSGNYGNAVADQIFDRLVYRTHDAKIKPRLATKWSISDDHKSMTFTLNSNAKWQDGQPLTADDVVFTCQAETSSKVSDYYRSAFNILAGTDDNGVASSPSSLGVKAVDKETVQFTFKSSMDPDSVLNAFCSFLYVLPKHLLDTGSFDSINGSAFWSKPVGSGPFMYDSDIAGQSITLDANTSYFQGSPHFKKLVIKVVPAANLTAGLIKGDIDVVAMGSIPLADWDTVKSNKNVVASSIPEYSYQYMLFNFKKTYFQSADVRTAFDMAINKQLIVKQLMKGEGSVCIGPMPTYHPYYDKNLKANAYNSTKAKELLTKAGWDFSRELLLAVPQGNQVREQSAVLIQQDLEKVGVKVKIQSYDFASDLAALRQGKEDLGLLGGGSNIDPGESDVIVKPNDSRNYSLLTDPTYYNIANQGSTLTSFAQRKPIYDEYQEALQKDQPYIWLYHQNDLFAHTKRIQNIPMDDFVWMNFASWEWTVK